MWLVTSLSGSTAKVESSVFHNESMITCTGPCTEWTEQREVLLPILKSNLKQNLRKE